ncbi:ATP-binding protein [Qipengyuania sp. JC766]|uniref:ATP-binding protein n=1 Tax=Qipengyuania sp. JC766 TaxID=3232139 RepID=UPI00345B18A4
MRFWPRSLLGQVLLAAAAALFVAQAISAVLLYRAAENRREESALTSAAFRLSENPDLRDLARERRAARRAAIAEARGSDRAEPDSRRRGGRLFRARREAQSPAMAGETSSPELERRLAALLENQGIEAAEVRAIVRRSGRDPVVREAAQDGSPFASDPDWADRRILVSAIRLAGEDGWRVVRSPLSGRDDRAVGPILFQTAIIFCILMGVLFVLLRRITRPLGQLTRRTRQFARTQDASNPLEPSGPEDIETLITAHNALEARIVAMLDEKDVMLGAIGHDLKTPLAALRVRIESVEDDGQRAKMAEGIEDIAATLDDILSLARIGRSDGPPEPVELSALVASVVEEYEDLGEPVDLLHTARLVRPVHLTWLKRALRNLIGNALRYGHRARVALLTEGKFVVLRVEDDGPGIAEGQIDRMFEPFQRGETSRNRTTGGAGLGLTLARAIAEQHGGKLVLANRAEGGLRAELRLPKD